MAKEKKARVKKEKVSGRKPTLAPFIDGTFLIYGSYKGKEFNARVLSSGVIVFDEKEYATPSSAGRAAMIANGAPAKVQIDGWKFWMYNKDDKRVPIDTLRGKKSPLEKKEAAA